MKAKKQFNFYNRVAIYLIFFVSQFFIFPINFSAAALANVEALISDSRIGAKVDLRLRFTTSVDIGDGGYFEFTLDEEFKAVSEVFCPGPNALSAVSGNTVRCTYSLSPGAATSSQVTITNMYNPSDSGRYNIQMDTYDAADVLLESGNAAVFITEIQKISAYVGTILTFSMEQEDVSEVNGVPVTGTSSATFIDFGTLSSGVLSTMAQTINIRTNAQNGFACTVQQDHELTSENSAVINSFNNSFNGTGSSTEAQPWAPPKAFYDQNHTYGHLGLTSNDPDLSVLDFSGSKYVGFNGTDPVEIFYHPTATVNETIGEGKVHVAYTLEVSALQEEGSYTNKIMYVCTGNF